MAVLEKEVLREMKHNNDSNQSGHIIANGTRLKIPDVKCNMYGNYGKSDEEEPVSDVASGLTLLRMKTWMQEPIDRLLFENFNAMIFIA